MQKRLTGIQDLKLHRERCREARRKPWDPSGDAFPPSPVRAEAARTPGTATHDFRADLPRPAAPSSSGKRTGTGAPDAPVALPPGRLSSAATPRLHPPLPEMKRGVGTRLGAPGARDPRLGATHTLRSSFSLPGPPGLGRQQPMGYGPPPLSQPIGRYQALPQLEAGCARGQVAKVGLGNECFLGLAGVAAYGTLIGRQEMEWFLVSVGWPELRRVPWVRAVAGGSGSRGVNGGWLMAQEFCKAVNPTGRNTNARGREWWQWGMGLA